MSLNRKTAKTNISILDFVRRSPMSVGEMPAWKRVYLESYFVRSRAAPVVGTSESEGRPESFRQRGSSPEAPNQSSGLG